MSKSEFEGEQSVVTGTNQASNLMGQQNNISEYKVSITKIKNVFKILITECPFLIDDKAYVESQGKQPKE